MIKCRIIGGIKAEQSEDDGKKMIRNDRFLAIPKCSNIFEKVKSVEDLPEQIMHDLEQFFVDYNKLEGKKFKALGDLAPKEAQEMISSNNKKH